MRNLRIFLALFPSVIWANEGLLLDTRHATSDLGWTVAPGSEWDEVSGHGADKNEYRMLQVCEIQQPNQDNWIRSHYIDTFKANRVFVEIEFTIRSCEDLRNVAVCKETFNLYYYQAENAQDLPDWSERDFKKVDTIAADRRFKPGEDETNKEVREITNLSKKGLFIAIQDAGACMSIMHMRVYYNFCPPITTQLAQFDRKISGPTAVSLEAAEGRCVPNSVQASKMNPPKNHCNALGNWDMRSGDCLCAAGYTPNNDYTQCVACDLQSYKSGDGNESCRKCPPNSMTFRSGATSCECIDGYDRARDETHADGCTRRPTRPRDLRLTSNQTSIQLDWSRPANNGGRNDIEYHIGCQVCPDGSQLSECKKCPSSVRIIPAQITDQTHATATNLIPSQFYKFKIIAINGVTGEYNPDSYPDYVENVIQTSDSSVSNTASIERVDFISKTASTIRFKWSTFGSSSISEFETVLTNKNSEHQIVNKTIQESIEIEGLEPSTLYSFTVRPKTNNGYGRESAPYEVTTDAEDDGTITSEPRSIDSTTDNTAKIAGIAAGVAVIIIMVVVFLVICTKRNSYKKGRKFVTELDGPDVTFQPVHPFQPEHPFQPVQWDHDVINLKEPVELDPSRVTIGSSVRSHDSNGVELLKGTMLTLDGYSSRTVLIKRLKNGATQQQKSDFQNDASILSRIGHENVLAVEGIITSSRQWNITVVEWIEHTALDEFLRLHRREFNQTQQLRMMVDVALAMKYLVDNGYVHRDLAAKNIMCNAQLKCKIGDFSMAKKLSESQFPHQMGQTMLYKWAAPEAISQRRFSEASDVWSFGIVAWEIQNSGEMPYWEMNDEEVIRKVESGYRLPCTTGCPPHVHQLMLDCWKASPNERVPFSVIVKNLDRFIRSQNPQMGQSHRSSQYSGSCMTLDSNTSNTSSLAGWLEGIGLGHYRERLQQNGYTTLENIVSMSRRDLQDLGIVSASEQKHLLDQARILHSQKTARPMGYSQRCEMSLERGTIIGV